MHLICFVKKNAGKNYSSVIAIDVTLNKLASDDDKLFQERLLHAAELNKNQRD